MEPSESKKKFNLKRWLGITGLVVLVGGLGWLGYTAYQQNQTIADQTTQLTDLKSQVALLQASPVPSPSPSALPSISPTPLASGTITGTIAYPAGTAPAQTICAVKSTDAAATPICVKHGGSAAGSLAYSLSVPAGTYYVYASLQAPAGSFTTDYKAYYNKYVTCGNAASCPAADHKAYLPVTIKGIQTVKDINPTDWYATGQ